jgi:hypothetical protein
MIHEFECAAQAMHSNITPGGFTISGYAWPGRVGLNMAFVQAVKRWIPSSNDLITEGQSASVLKYAFATVTYQPIADVNACQVLLSDGKWLTVNCNFVKMMELWGGDASREE